MSYTVLIKRQAAKKLLSLPRQDRTRIAEKIQMLGFDPDDPALDVKKFMPLHHSQVVGIPPLKKGGRGDLWFA